jgi:cerevisin
MDDVMKLLIFACLLFWGKVFATSHKSGGAEHIVIINRDHPAPPHVSEVLNRLELSEGHPDVRLIYNNSAFRGFAASMKSHCLDLLANMSDVSIVEEATAITRSAPIISKRQASLAYDTRPNAPWGLQRISTAAAVGGNAQAMDYTYSFANSGLGKGADIYVIDTGVYTRHNVFNGRATMAWSYDGNMTDLDGHGTHVSGTAAGNLLGVASNANIFGVKALDSDGGGWSSNVIAGIDFVVQQHDARKANQPEFTGSVMSMSLASGSPVQAITTAIDAAISAGVHTVVAAGNDDKDACKSSPASSGGTHGAAITVGSVGMSAERSSFSNYGDCVDVYAPGENVISAWIGAPDMVNDLSGTSMATPHVTGIVAYAMGNQTLANDPALMKEWVRMTALPMSNGILLANNGVQADRGEGMLGFEKVAAKAVFRVASTRGSGLVT